MESVLTVRLDACVKERGASIMRQLGTTPSNAVRELFDYTIRHEALPFPASHEENRSDASARIAAFDRCHTKHPLNLSDDELRERRLRERYEPIS